MTTMRMIDQRSFKDGLRTRVFYNFIDNDYLVKLYRGHDVIDDELCSTKQEALDRARELLRQYTIDNPMID